MSVRECLGVGVDFTFLGGVMWGGEKCGLVEGRDSDSTSRLEERAAADAVG